MNPQEIAAALQNGRVRPTQQRIAVYDYLLQHPVHPTADTIYRALLKEYPTFSRTTIYNSLHVLVQAGLIRSVNIEAEEQRFDGNAADHGHFKCKCCGRIYDFELEGALLHQLCPPGFEPDVQDIFVVGLCPACSGKRPEPQ